MLSRLPPYKSSVRRVSGQNQPDPEPGNCKSNDSTKDESKQQVHLPDLGTFRLVHFPGLIHFSFVAVSKRRSEQSSGQGDASFGEIAGRSRGESSGDGEMLPIKAEATYRL